MTPRTALTMELDEKQVAELSYTEMSTDASGQIIPKHKKESARRELGYCLTCPHIPTLVFDVRRSKLNPLARAKKTPLTVSGQCFMGKCLKCFPDKKKRRSSGNLTASFNAPSLGSSANSSCDGSPLGLSGAEARSIPDSQHLVNRSWRGSRRLSNPRDHLGDAAGLRQTQTQPLRIRRSSSSGSSVDTEKQAPSIAKSTRSHDGLWPSSGSRTTSSSRPRRSSNRLSEQHEPLDHSSLSRTQPTRRQQHVSRSCSDSSENEPVFSSPLICRGSARQCSSEHLPSTRRNQRIVRCDPLRSKEKHVANESGCSSSLTDTDLKVGTLKEFFMEIRETKCPEVFADSVLSSMKEHATWEKGQIICCRELLLAIGTEDTCGEHFVRSGGHAATLETASAFGGSRLIEELCCEIIFELAKTENVRATLIHEGSCKFVNKMLLKEIANEKLINNALGALRIFSTVPQARQQLFRHNTTGVVLDVMACNPQNSMVQRDGCAIIANMAYDDGEILTVDNPVIKAASDALLNNLTDSCVTSSACFTLNNLSFNRHNLRVMVGLPDLLETLKTVANAAAQDLLEKLQLVRAKDESIAMQGY